MPASPEMPATPGRMALSLAMVGLPRAIGARAMIEQAATMGFRAIHLDATHPDVRPRALSRSARKDLAALLRRADLACSGVDLFAPPAHLSDPARADHAIAAFTQAIEFTAEMSKLTGAPSILSTTFPSVEASPDARAIIAQLAECADAFGVHLADHAWMASGHAQAHTSRGAPLGMGIDPAALLMAGADPARTVSTLGASTGPGILAARLSDTDGTARIEPGASAGRLDAFAYAIALHTAGYEGHIALDVRGVNDPLAAAARARERFDSA